jgi:hypothetical protein
LFKSSLPGFINWLAFANLKAGLEQSPNGSWGYSGEIGRRLYAGFEQSPNCRWGYFKSDSRGYQ